MLAAVLRCVMFIWIYRIAALRTTRARFAMGHLLPPRVAGEERKFVPAARFFASEFCQSRHCEERKRRGNPGFLRCKWIASLLLAMTTTKLVTMTTTKK